MPRSFTKISTALVTLPVCLTISGPRFCSIQLDAADPEVSNAFHITRAYLGLRVRLTSWLSGRVTYDVSQLSLYHTAVVLAGTWAEFLLPVLLLPSFPFLLPPF